MKNYEVIVIGCSGIGSAVLAPHAYEAELGLRLLFETSRQQGCAVTEMTRVMVKSILTAVFGSNGPRTGQETSR